MSAEKEIDLDQYDISREEYERRLQEKVQEVMERKLEQDDGARVSRRRFLKALGLGAGTVGLSSFGASLFKLTSPSKKSSVNADQVGGLDVMVDTLSNRPAAGQSGRLFYSSSGDGIYYDNGSSWVQVSKAAPIPVDEVTTDVVLNGQTVDLKVYEDTTGDGAADNTETVSVSNGTNTYTLNNLSGGSGNDYWVEWQISTSSDTAATPKANSVQLKNVGTWETAAEWDSAQSESGVVHESVSNTSNNDASGVKKGYSISSPLYSSSLIGYWPLQEGSGSTAYDFSGNNNDGTVNGSPVAGGTGPLGVSSYSFDGSTDYISLPFRPSGQTAFTVSAWIKLNTHKLNRIWMHGKDSNYSYSALTVNSSGIPGVSFEDAQSDGVSASASSSISTGQWYMLTGTFDSGTATMYVDAVQVGSGTNTAVGSVDQIETTSDATTIGRECEFSENFFNGIISDVRLYNRALSASQIQTMYDVVTTQGSLTTAAKTS
ncbi:MAG: LamG domain-containing protein [Candidatus Nanohaloarchaea archaeon]